LSGCDHRSNPVSIDPDDAGVARATSCNRADTRLRHGVRMISEPDMIPAAGDELVNHLFLVLLAAIVGAAFGLGLGAWLTSYWAAALIG